MTINPTPSLITLPGFPDEDGDGCPDGFTPNPDFVKPGPGEPCIAVTTSTPLPDVLAHTGPLDTAATLFVGALLVAAGIALLKGRHA